MSTIQKQSILGATSSYLGVGIGFLNKIILFPLVFLDQRDYWGLIELFTQWSTFVAGVATLGIPIAFNKYLPAASVEDRGKYIRLGTRILLFGGLIFTALFLTQPNSIASFAKDPDFVLSEYNALLLMCLGMFVWEWGNGLLTSSANAHVGVFMNSVIQRVMVAILLITKIIFDYDVSTFISGVALSYLLTSAITIAMGFRSFKGSAETSNDYDPKEFFKFSGVSLLIRGTSLAMTSMDVLIGGLLLPIYVIPVLGIAKYFNTVMLIPGRAISRGAISQISKAWKVHDKEKLSVLYKKTALTGLGIGLSIFVAIWIWIDHVILLLQEGFEMLPIVFMITSFGILFNLMAGINSHLINLSTFYRLNLWSNLSVLILGVAATYWLTETYGIIGTAIGFSLIIVMANVIRGLVIWYKVGIHPFSPNLFRTIAVFIALILIHQFTPDGVLWSVIMTLLWLIGVWLVWVRWQIVPQVYELVKRFLPKFLS